LTIEKSWINVMIVAIGIVALGILSIIFLPEAAPDIVKLIIAGLIGLFMGQAVVQKETHNG